MRKLLYPLAAFLLTSSLFAADPFLGTWKLNIAKSKYTGANPAPKDLTIVVETHGDQVIVSGKGTAADGSLFQSNTWFQKQAAAFNTRKEGLQEFQRSLPREKLVPVPTMRRTRKTAK
jgi:hypothetical protein